MEIWKKLNLKEGQKVLVLNNPFGSEFINPLLQSGYSVKEKEDKKEPVQFALAFVQSQEEVEYAMQQIKETLDTGDIILWMAYPKGSSRKYKSSINRDSGWQPLGKAGFEPVRQVALDDDWSVLRFRRLEFIKKMTRSEKMRLTNK